MAYVPTEQTDFKAVEMGKALGGILGDLDLSTLSCPSKI